MFLTTTEFLPQHRHQRQQLLQLVTAAEARGQQRLAEMSWAQGLYQSAEQNADLLRRVQEQSRREVGPSLEL